MICCRNCAKTAVVLTVLAPLLTLVVLGVSHDKSKHTQTLLFVSHLLIQLSGLIIFILSAHSWLWPEHKAGGRKTGPTNCKSCQETGDLSNNSQNPRNCVFHLSASICLQSNLITDSHGSLLFDPPLLDFGDWYTTIYHLLM